MHQDKEPWLEGKLSTVAGTKSYRAAAFVIAKLLTEQATLMRR